MSEKNFNYEAPSVEVIALVAEEVVCASQEFNPGNPFDGFEETII